MFNYLLYKIFSVYQKFQSYNKVVRWLILYFIFGTLGTFFFRWRLGNQLALLSNLDGWATALDISLAHASITFPLIVISLYLIFFLSLVLFLASLLISDWISNIFKKNASDEKTSSSDFSCCWIIFYPILAVYGLFRFDKLLLVDTIDLQEYIFGVYDGNIGLVYPTSFRFTFIIDRFTLYWQNLTTNPILSKIFAGLAAIIVAVGAVVSFLKLIDNLIEIINKKRTK
ncbi:MAG: hypothetical protein HY869_05470 [Chloroflexi bacterium]|nr:hypothetical protein [Chloroflexota bacterium]